jgi:hypothetical protein
LQTQQLTLVPVQLLLLLLLLAALMEEPPAAVAAQVAGLLLVCPNHRQHQHRHQTQNRQTLTCPTCQFPWQTCRWQAVLLLAAHWPAAAAVLEMRPNHRHQQLHLQSQQSRQTQTCQAFQCPEHHHQLLVLLLLMM